MTRSNPWDRMEGESRKAYDAFLTYRDMGVSRSIEKAVEKYAKATPGSHPNVRYWKRWSSAWSWVERCEAWDDWQDELTDRELQKGIVAMRKRHAQQAVMLSNKAISSLANMSEDVSQANIPKYLETALRMERLSRGEPTENVQQTYVDPLPEILKALENVPGAREALMKLLEDDEEEEPS